MGMNQTELKDMLNAHKEWLVDNSKGKRLVLDSSADLRYANLRSANLSSADLRYANLRSADLRSADLSSADLRYANLRSADLRSADLSSADLRYANLRSADLRSADLRSADLRYANLRSANLSSANLSSANLRSANLSSADLSSADLRYANLRSADLSSADLRSADLSSADLTVIKEDFFKRILIAKNEAKGLFDFVQKGKVNGTSYEGECACFVGTISKITKENYKNLSCGLEPDSNSPTEKWFLAILTGDTPASNQVSKITCDWISEFCKENNIALPNYKIVSSDECPEAFV